VSRIAVLKGGRSLERNVSLRSGARVEDALERLGHDVSGIDVGGDLVQRLRGEGFDAAFVALHGRDGEDGTVQELLEILGVPYTGSGVLGCARTIDKVLAKHLCFEAGVPTPPFFSFNESAFDRLGAAETLPAIEERLDFPIVVKPARGGSALGIKFAREPRDVPSALVAAFSYDSRVVLERHVAGRDLAVSIVEGADGPQPLPVVEAVPRGEAFYDFEARYEIGRTDFVCPAELGARAGARDLPPSRPRVVRPRRPDARGVDRRAVRARGQRDPRPHRDQPAAAGGRGRRDRLRPPGGTDPRARARARSAPGGRLKPVRLFDDRRTSVTMRVELRTKGTE
jgi:D-alanine-D-alanine ligase